ncbi:MAG TPA: MoaD/ThiS family protein [Gammaproteobacteria bacterium]|nr:MoaD/ThiS family protein [Gammaproteobacteria bacterium]
MQITLKLYASLGAYLPPQATNNRIQLDLKEGTTVAEVIHQYRIPAEQAHLVLHNGAYVAPALRTQTVLKNGQSLAIWPPVAGG